MSTTNGLSADQKKMLGISAATLLLGGAAWAVASKIPKSGSSPEGQPGMDLATPTTPVGALPADIDVAGKTTDAMSFDEAFEAARNEVGVGGVFNWHGRWYNTFLKDEWTDLSLEQRVEFTEMVTQEELPFKPYHSAKSQTGSRIELAEQTKPTVIEGYVNGRRVIGIDDDNDGVIDTLVLDGEDGHTYRVVDETGDQGLDTVYKYDAIDGELVMIQRITPTVLSNDDFGQHLEHAMSREVVDSIVDTDAVDDQPVPPTDATLMQTTADEMDAETYAPEVDSMSDDTYVNNGNVQDMES
ncbi:hypothetical protein [Spirosoma montaniterrae]|nr:hypothetical protein [Spirosoma montaniterrae]